jgi:hypothetical protein
MQFVQSPCHQSLRTPCRSHYTAFGKLRVPLAEWQSCEDPSSFIKTDFPTNVLGESRMRGTGLYSASRCASALTEPLRVSAHSGNDPISQEKRREAFFRIFPKGLAPRARKGADRVSPTFRARHFSRKKFLMPGLCRPGDPPPGSSPLRLLPPSSPEGRVACAPCNPLPKGEKTNERTQERHLQPCY